jgi:iron(III) transport system substrate-binding protein
MKMKTFGKLLTIVLLLSFLVGCSAATSTPTVAEKPAQPAQVTQPTTAPEVAKPADTAVPQSTEVPPTVAPALTAKEEWLKANLLGPYSTDKQDWAAIEEAAKKEGKVVVYANTSKISKAAEGWAEKYPDIAIEGYDLGGDDVLSKTIGEQQSGTVVGDVWFSSGGAELVGNVLPHEYVWKFVPDTTSVAPQYTDPLLFSRFGTTILAYNKELNKECPVKNLWELTQPEWKGKFVIEDPLNDASTLSKLITIAYHADEMKQAYIDLYGKEPELDSDTPDAGWLWFKRFAQNGPIPQPGGDEVDSAFATPGMKENLLAFTSYSNYPDVQDGNLAFEPCWGVNPISGIQSQSYAGIMNQATHPNAAKLFIQYITSAEGRDPWAKFGTYFPDPTYTVPEGQKTLDEAQKLTWFIPEKYAYDKLVDARDMYLMNLGTAE